MFLDESSQWHVRWVDVDDVKDLSADVESAGHEEVFEFVIVASGSLEKRKFYGMEREVPSSLQKEE